MKKKIFTLLVIVMLCVIVLLDSLFGLGLGIELDVISNLLG